ncbi:MAG: helix-turn-helix domain-containing protein, partial [Gammaproteobacteria bacterium]
DIREVRKKLNLSQSEFALMIGVSLSTLQNWEQGRRRPEGPAQALLKVAASNPKAVIDALASVRREGRRVILEAADEWSDKFRACLGVWPGEIPRPKQRQLRDLRDPFA